MDSAAKLNAMSGKWEQWASAGVHVSSAVVTEPGATGAAASQKN